MTGYESKRAAARDKLKCQCSTITKLVGSGCQYCNPEYMDDDDDDTQVYKKPWVGLTQEEILDLFDTNNVYGSKWIEFARSVETKLKEKNL